MNLGPRGPVGLGGCRSVGGSVGDRLARLPVDRTLSVTSQLGALLSHRRLAVALNSHSPKPSWPIPPVPPQDALRLAELLEDDAEGLRGVIYALVATVSRGPAPPAPDLLNGRAVP